jgi:hypothetical protein
MRAAQPQGTRNIRSALDMIALAMPLEGMAKTGTGERPSNNGFPRRHPVPPAATAEILRPFPFTIHALQKNEKPNFSSKKTGPGERAAA